MIPDHLIGQAAAAIYAATVFDDEFALDAWHDMNDDNPIKTTTRMYARAALEAVAADIWGHGYNEGRIAELLRELGVIADSEQLPNPYRASRPHDGQPPQAYPAPHRTDR